MEIASFRDRQTSLGLPPALVTTQTALLGYFKSYMFNSKPKTMLQIKKKVQECQGILICLEMKRSPKWLLLTKIEYCRLLGRNWLIILIMI